MYSLSQPALAVVLAIACSLQQTSSRPKAAHFAAAVERSLYFVFAVAIVLALACPNPNPNPLLPGLRDIRPQHLLRIRRRPLGNAFRLPQHLLTLVRRLQVVLRQPLLLDLERLLRRIGNLKPLQLSH